MKKSIFLFALLGLLTGGQLFAAHLRSGDEVNVSESVTGNLYVAGKTVAINAPISADLICAGSEVEINAPVGADILLGGGDVTINSKTGGDVRMAGGEVTLNADVAGDLIIAGGELHIPKGITISGDVYIAGGKVIFDGTALGDVNMAGGEVAFNGVAEGNFIAKGGKLYINGEIKGKASLAAEELNIGSDASFHQAVEYWNEKGDVNFDGHLKDGAAAKYNENLKVQTRIDREVVKKGFAAFAAFRFLSALLLMTLLISFFNSFFAKNAGQIPNHLGKYLGIGSLFFVGVPMAAGLACATVIGIPIGFILFSGWGVGLVLANSLTAVVAAYELRKYLNRDWGKGILIAIAVVSFVALRLVGMMAIPGKFIVFAATAIAIGAVIQWMRKGWQKGDDAPNEAPAASADKNEEPSDLV